MSKNSTYAYLYIDALFFFFQLQLTILFYIRFRYISLSFKKWKQGSLSPVLVNNQFLIRKARVHSHIQNGYYLWDMENAAQARDRAPGALVTLPLLLISFQSCVCSKKSEMPSLQMPAFSCEVQSHSTCKDEWW